MALVTASGPLGLSAVFPAPDAAYTRPRAAPGAEPPGHTAPPHLPLTATWQEADFALPAALAPTMRPGDTVSLRLWSMELLARYLYTSARSTEHFYMLTDAAQARRAFAQLAHAPDVAILGLNDNIEDGYDEVKDTMEAWMRARWPQPAVWERAWGAA